MDVAARLAGALCTLLIPIAVLARPAPAPPVEGRVSQVLDGNRLSITPAGQPPILVRLRDSDAPVACQPGAEQARRALSEMALDQPATLKPAGRGAGGSTLGVVLVNGRSLALRMVEEGQAWSVRTHWDQGPLVKQERMARSLRRGLHAEAGAVSPREFVRAHGPCPPDDAPPPVKAAVSAGSR